MTLLERDSDYDSYSEPRVWARTEERFARKYHTCTGCHSPIDEEPYTRTIETNEVGGLNIYIFCRDCVTPRAYAA